MYNIVLRCIRFSLVLALAAGLCLMGTATDVPAQTPKPAEKTPQVKSKSQTRISEPEEKLPEILYDLKKLPALVLKKRNAIIKAAKTGQLNALKKILAENKLTPTFSFGGGKDPLEYWKHSSGDKYGRSVLAEMVRIFSSGFVVMSKGTENELYVWPYHFAYEFEKLTPAQEVELYLLITPEEKKSMVDIGGYVGYRGGISRDGTWQFFVAGD